MIKSGLLGILLASACCTAEPTAPPEPIAVSPKFQLLITQLTKELIPHNYVDEKDWGQTKELVTGLYVKRDGLRLRTHRTRTAMNHGTWKRYRIDLVDPAREFRVQLENVRRQPDGRVACDVICDAKVRVFGRVSQWQRGVQLFSLSAEAEADVRVTLQCDLALQVDTKTSIPDVQLDPVVRNADLYFNDFRMREISQLDGPLVRNLSSSVREVAEQALAKRREKIVQKLNRQVAKNQDHLRLSITEMLDLAASQPPAPAN